jgi:hypothetical protein
MDEDIMRSFVKKVCRTICPVLNVEKTIGVCQSRIINHRWTDSKQQAIVQSGP